VAVLAFLPDVLAAFDQFQQWVSSDWAYLAIFSVAMIDAFFPVVPSESLVVTAGVFAAAGDQSLALVIAAAALGAFVGDHVSYAVGSQAGEAHRPLPSGNPEGRRLHRGCEGPR